MKLTEETLRRAAVLADAMELASLPDKETCPQHCFSRQFEQEMETLLGKVERGEIATYSVHLGWPYYARRGVAAVLICFLLTCLAAPEAVQAGCAKLMEAVRYVVTEYTEYRYHSTVSEDTAFVPLEIGYLPEGMELAEKYEDESELHLLYRNGMQYFILDQRIITENSHLTYRIDTENARVERKVLREYEIDFSHKDGEIIYIWTYNQYLIAGGCNLSEEELEKILDSVLIK